MDLYAPVKPTDDTVLVDGVTATSGETLSEKHIGEPLPGSWPSEILWVNESLLL